MLPRIVLAIAIALVACGSVDAENAGAQTPGRRPCAEQCDRERRACEDACLPGTDESNVCNDRCSTEMVTCTNACP